MDIELLIMKQNLDRVLRNESINSGIVLSLSQELDKIILKYYQKQSSSQNG